MNDAASAAATAEWDFADVIAPTTIDEFFSEYWGKRPLYVPGRRDRFEGLFSKAILEELLPRCRQIKAGFRDENGWYTDLLVHADQVKRLAEAKMTVCAGVLPPDPRMTPFIEAYRRAVSFAGEVHFNAYMSPDNSGFSLHLDDHPVLILQIEGSKHWWVWPEVGVENPPRGFSFPPNRDVLRVPWGTYERPAAERFLEYTLQAGDVLYVPAGAWHHTRAIGFSLALTMASGAITPLELGQAALMEQLPGHVNLTHRLWGGDARALASGEMPEDMRPMFEEAAAGIREMAGSIDADTLFRIWSARRQ